MESMRKSKTFTAQSRSGWLVTFYNPSFSKHSILVLDGNSFGRIMGWDGRSNLVVHLPVKAWTDTSNAIWHWQAGISTHILPAPPCSKETAWWASPGRQGIQTWKQWITENGNRSLEIKVNKQGSRILLSIHDCLASLTWMSKSKPSAIPTSVRKYWNFRKSLQ